jgi:C1A family cysteine protease
MECRVVPVLAAFVLAAMAVPCTPTTLAAQTPVPAQTDIVDQPDVVYHTGLLPEDPAVELRRSIVKHHRAFLPLTVDLSSRMPEVGDQGRTESCAAWATAYAARSYYTNALENRNTRQASNLPSPSYVYHLARGKSGCDQGTTIGSNADVLKNGALSLADYPFTEVCSPPASPDLVARAHDFKVEGLSRVDFSQPDDIKGQLAQANPVIISFKVSTAWMRFRGPGVFTEAVPPADDKNQGGHAMTIVGYDEHRQAFRLINSWGKIWGDHGYAWMGYDLLRSRIRGAYVLNMAGSRPQVVVPPRPEPPPQPKPEPGPTPTPIVQLSELQSLSCGHVTVDQQGGQSVLSGYVATDDDLNRVKSIAASVPNVSVGNVIVAPWPQCEALQTLEKPLQIADRPTVEVGPKTELQGGDPLRIQLRSPGQISYLYVSYIQADGSVVHLVQPAGLVPQPTLPRQTLVFGGGEQGKPKFTVGPPFGREMIIAIASRSPLFDHDLPRQQTERDYLTELRRALVYKPTPDLPDRELAAAITTLQTRER